MKPILPVTLAALSIAGHVAAADGTAISHQIVGKWQRTHAESKCTEVYEFRPDGAFLIVSGDHTSTGTFSISERQNAQGYYELKLEPSKAAAGPPCPGSPLSGDATSPTLYVIFHRTQPLQLLCETPALEKCLGPLRRISQ